MTENPPPPSGTPEGDGTPPPPPNPYGSQGGTPPPPPQNPYASQPPPAPQNPYASQPPPPAQPYAGNPPTAGQSPYGAAPGGQTPYGATPFPVDSSGPAPVVGAQPGGLGARFVARLIDFIIVGIVVSFITAATGRLIGGVIGGILYLGYFAFLESSRGQTLGKQILKQRVLGSAGGNPTMEEALRRNAWLGLSIFSGVVLLGLLTGLAEFVAMVMIAVTISQDPLKRGWHDKFGNTTVTREG